MRSTSASTTAGRAAGAGELPATNWCASPSRDSASSATRAARAEPGGSVGGCERNAGARVAGQQSPSGSVFASVKAAAGTPGGTATPTASRTPAADVLDAHPPVLPRVGHREDPAGGAGRPGSCARGRRTGGDLGLGQRAEQAQ